MQIELRDPKKIMKLKRLGSFHQSKLSFLRSFLREFYSWDYKRELFELDNDGYVRFHVGNIVNKEVKLDIFNFAMEKVHSNIYNLNSYYKAQERQ